MINDISQNCKILENEFNYSKMQNNMNNYKCIGYKTFAMNLGTALNKIVSSELYQPLNSKKICLRTA